MGLVYVVDSVAAESIAKVKRRLSDPVIFQVHE